MRVVHDEYWDVIDRKSCGTCAKRELVERISVAWRLVAFDCRIGELG